MYFHYFAIIHPFKGVVKTWMIISPKVLTSTGTCAKFGWNFPSGSGEDNENLKTFWSGNLSGLPSWLS